MKIGDSVLELKIGDITMEDTEAVVNAANSSLMGGGGVDGAIHRRGGETIHKECREIIKEIGSLNPGHAAITGGGNLKAKYVIHTVGPVWYGGDSGEEKILRSAYRKSLEIALSKNIKSVSFPSISTGAYAYPVDKASYSALDEVYGFLKNNNGISLVRFILYDEHTYGIYKETFERLINEKFDSA